MDEATLTTEFVGDVCILLLIVMSVFCDSEGSKVLSCKLSNSDVKFLVVEEATDCCDEVGAFGGLPRLFVDADEVIDATVDSETMLEAVGLGERAFERVDLAKGVFRL